MIIWLILIPLLNNLCTLRVFSIIILAWTVSIGTTLSYLKLYQDIVTPLSEHTVFIFSCSVCLFCLWATWHRFCLYLFSSQSCWRSEKHFWGSAKSAKLFFLAARALIFSLLLFWDWWDLNRGLELELIPRATICVIISSLCVIAMPILLVLCHYGPNVCFKTDSRAQLRGELWWPWRSSAKTFLWRQIIHKTQKCCFYRKFQRKCCKVEKHFLQHKNIIA